ncbi:MAG: alpha/beta fold hydrolase [Pseudomonadota bacterium]
MTVPPPITRKIIMVGSRHVHIRFCGEGPPVLLLHQSPRTSEELTALMQAWGAHFCCIVPDHPGYGLSDPLPSAAPNIDDFADATAALLDALGIEQLPIYGHHTGAKIALSLAVRHPQRIASLVLNGLLINTQADRDDLAENYLPPFEPSQDARHLVQLWWRMREQTLFFPWYNRKTGARMVFGVRPAAEIQPSVLDFLAAEDNYRRGYGAALAMVAKDYVDQLNVNALITAVKSDPLWVDVGRLQSTQTTTIDRFDTMEPLLSAALAKLKEGASDQWSFEGIDQNGTRKIEAGLTTYHAEPDNEPTALFLPDLGSEWLCEKALLDASTASILAINPAGHGLSQSDADWPQMDSIQKIITMGLGYAHLPPLLERYPDAQLVLIDALLPTDDAAGYLQSYVPDLTPTPSGSHLAEAFLRTRSDLVFWPWNKTEHANAIPGEHLFDAYALHVKSRALLRGWQAGRQMAEKAQESLNAVLNHTGDVQILLPDWAEQHSGLQQDFGKARISYYAFKNRTAALAAALG